MRGRLRTDAVTQPLLLGALALALTLAAGCSSRRRAEPPPPPRTRRAPAPATPESTRAQALERLVERYQHDGTRASYLALRRGLAAEAELWRRAAAPPAEVVFG